MRAHYANSLVGSIIGGSSFLAPLVSATVHLYQEGTSSHITETIYSSATGSSTLANPFTADLLGGIEFWLDRQKRLDLYIVYPGLTAQRLTADVLRSEITIFDPKRDFGAKYDGSFDDWPAITNATAEAKAAGAAGLPGATVLLREGEPRISQPWILPRSGATPQNVVQVLGRGSRNTRLGGLGSSWAARALIEWDNGASVPAWHQSIRNMGFLVPNVAGAMAINYKPNDKSTGAACLAERLQLDLKNLLFEGNNQYHSSSVRLEGNISASSFRRLYGDPGQGSPNNYDTVVLEFDQSDYGAEGADASGGTFCHFSEIYSAIRRGGFSGVFKGRLIRSTIQQMTASFARISPTLELIKSTNVIVSGYSNEGGGSQPQLKLTDCSNLTFVDLGIGSPIDRGLGVGNGAELVNVRDSRFLGMWRRTGVPTFNAVGKKILTLDANCKRNEFLNWTLNGSLANEVLCNAPDTADNYGEFYDIQNSTRYFMGRRPQPRFTVATRPSAADWPGVTIYVSDGAAGAKVQVSNGTTWVNLG
jgi:hypothetical protein